MASSTTSGASAKRPSKLFGWRLADDRLNEWHERGIGGCIVGCCALEPVRYALRSSLGSREGTDDGGAMGTRNGRASVATGANLGLVLAIRVCEKEPNRMG